MNSESVEQEKVNAEPLSRAARKKLKKQARDKDQQEKTALLVAKTKKKKLLMWSITSVAILAIIGFFIFLFSGETTGPFSGGEVHWHASVKVLLCGIQQSLPAPQPNAHLGSPLLHTHDDKQIHVEGTVWKAEDITLGKYMSAIGLTFTNDKLLDKENGDLCDGKLGKVKLFVDGKENTELASYVIHDKESYELRFE